MLFVDALAHGNRTKFPQLTLFPRVSKTSETNLGYRLAILWEHFFKHRLFEHDELVILTLMKGDEGVELSKELANFFLLSTVWDSDFCAQ